MSIKETKFNFVVSASASFSRKGKLGAFPGNQLGFLFLFSNLPFCNFFLFLWLFWRRGPFFRVLMKHKCFLSPFADVFRICMRIGQALAAPCQYSCKSLSYNSRRSVPLQLWNPGILCCCFSSECLLLLLLLYQTILLAMLSHLFNCLPGPIPRDDLISVAKRLEGEIKSKNSEYSCSPHSVNSDCSSFYCWKCHYCFLLYLLSVTDAVFSMVHRAATSCSDFYTW